MVDDDEVAGPRLRSRQFHGSRGSRLNGSTARSNEVDSVVWSYRALQWGPFYKPVGHSGTGERVHKTLFLGL